MGRIVVIVFCMVCIVCGDVNARALHIGDYSVEFTTTKHTTPSLNVLTENGERFYGAVYSPPIPPKVLHFLTTTGQEYFLGPWCDAGTYLPDDVNQCAPCGIGHFCTGGRHRESCTYGAIACSGTNHTFDPPMPAGTSGMYNRALTMAEVNQYIPATDIEQWQKVFKQFINQMAGCNSGENYPDNPNLNMFDTVVGPGTYVVTNIYRCPGTNGVFGHSAACETAYIVVFDHPVVYRPVHVCNHFGNYFDTQHVPYENYDFKLPVGSHLVNENITNISNIGDTFYDGDLTLGIFELK